MEGIKKYWEKEPELFYSAYSDKSNLPLSYFLKRRFSIVMNMLNHRRGENVLDIGCGDGLYIKYLLGEGCKVTGLDYSKAMLNAARKNLKGLRNCKLILGEFPNIKLNSSYDKIIAIGLLDYVKKVDSSFKEISRLLKRNGICILTLPKKYSPLFFLRIQFLRKLLLGLPGVNNLFTYNQISNLANRYKLKILDKRTLLGTMFILKIKKL